MTSSKEETVSDDSDIYEETKFREVIEKADDLQDDYHQRKRNIDLSDTMPNLSPTTWITGLEEGEIIDIKIENDTDDLLLDVRTRTGEVDQVRVRDRQSKYTDKNEIVRLLEYKNIEEGRIEKLLGKNIPMYVDRYALPSNEWTKMEWRPYIPKKTNSIGKLKHKTDRLFRYLGYEGEFQGKMMALGFLGVTLFWWGLIFTLLSTGMIFLNPASPSYGLVVTLITILSFTMTVYTPLIMRLVRFVREKYVEMRNKDNTLRS